LKEYAVKLPAQDWLMVQACFWVLGFQSNKATKEELGRLARKVGEVFDRG